MKKNPTHHKYTVTVQLFSFTYRYGINFEIRFTIVTAIDVNVPKGSAKIN